MNKSADEAWARRNSRGSTPRRPYMDGYEDGAFDERMRVVSFLSDNMTTITDFAGARTPELLAFMFREMKSV